MADRINMFWGAVVAATVFISYPIISVAQELRDPTRPAVHRGEKKVTKSSRSESWVLQSVLISPERRYAIINGRVVAPGESVNGALLVQVAEDSATLLTSGGRNILKLYPGSAALAYKDRTRSVVKTEIPPPPRSKQLTQSAATSPQK